MVTVHYLGRVISPGFNISIGFNPKILLNESAINFSCTFTVNVQNCNIDVECELASYNHADPVERSRLYVRAYDRVRTAVNLVSLASGRPQFVLLENLRLPDGTVSPIVFDDPGLASLCTTHRLNALAGDTSFDEMYKIVQADHELFLALDDLITAITFPHIAAINCGRVLDGLRRIMAPTLEKKAGWIAMQTALNIDPPYQKWVTDQSADPRHADRSFIPGATATDIVTRTWTIMNRFLEYKKRGGVTLRAPDFPLLT